MENLNNVEQKETPEEHLAKIDRLNEQLKNEEKKEKSGWKGFFWAILLALAIRSFAFEPYNIPSSSMLPSLLIGDYLFITKFDYGYSRHSFPLSLPIIPKGRVFYVEPKQGDVVVFKKPPENKVDYIKRIIGLPGDTVQMKSGQLYINGDIVPKKELGEEYWDTEGGKNHYTRYLETLPNGVEHLIYELGDNTKYDETEEVFVPQGYFFVMGDNRDNSLDSRYFGLVPMENLEGKARIIFYSTNGNGLFFQFWKWSEFLRLNRFFTDIK
ncbi:MAG: signal peptidase I [Alphaproteobacteria bacterium]|nr:signal peptidase I [Alphaproteobacteria bacterium]